MSLASIISDEDFDLPVAVAPAAIANPSPLTKTVVAPTISLPVPATRARNELIDVVRFFAAAGIVFIHASDSAFFEAWGRVFRFAVPFYLFASLYFQSISLRTHADRSLLQYVLCRVKRLYLPFLAWSAIYLIFHEIKEVRAHDWQAMQLKLSYLWVGTQYHLWFLPYLLAASIILAVVQRGILRQAPSLRWFAIGFLIALGILIGSASEPGHWSEFFDNPTFVYVQWWRSLPSMCWAMAFAWAMTMGTIVVSVPAIVGISGMLLVAIASLKQVAGGIQLIPRGLSGLGCMLFALTPWRGPIFSTLARYGRDGYGIYLCHVVFIQIAHLVAGKAHLAVSPRLDLATFVFSFIASVVTVRALAQSKLTAWLNG